MTVLTSYRSADEANERHDTVDDTHLIGRQTQSPHISGNYGQHTYYRPIEEEVV